MLHEVGELVLADVPGHVRELLRELVGQLERDVEAGLEVAFRTTGSVPQLGPAAALADGLPPQWRSRMRLHSDGAVAAPTWPSSRAHRR